MIKIYSCWQSKKVLVTIQEGFIMEKKSFFSHQRLNFEGGHAICFWKAFNDNYYQRLKVTKNLVAMDKNLQYLVAKKGFHGQCMVIENCFQLPFDS
jgi:hypothetical protein